MVRGKTVLAVAMASAWASSGCGGLTAPTDEGTDGEGELGAWVWAQGRMRTYSLHEPEGWSRSTELPLVVALHGAGGSGAGARQQMGLDPHSDRLRFLVAYPDGVEGTWSVECGFCFTAEILGVDDLRFLEVLVDHLGRHLPVDRERIYLMGFSNGGMLAILAACRGLPGLAGVGSVAAPLLRSVSGSCAPQSVFPIAHVHGTSDDLLPWNGRTLPGEVWPWLSVPETMDRWAALTGCDLGAPEVTVMVGSPGEPGAVERWEWTGCPFPGFVRLWRVEAGGHTWFRDADSGLDATAALVDFVLEAAGIASTDEGGGG